MQDVHANVFILVGESALALALPWVGWVLSLVLGACVIWMLVRSRRARPAASVAPAQAPTNAPPDLRALLDAIESPVIGFGQAGDVRYANKAACMFFEDRFTELIGTNAEQLFTQAEVLATIAQARNGVPSRTQVRIMRPLGQRIFQAVVFPLDSSSPRAGAVLSLRDVTDLAHAVQLKTDFVANASHELRTPLSSIRAAIETMTHDARDDPPMQERLSNIIASNVTRLEDLVADLLDLSRLESAEATPTLAPVDAFAVIAELADLFAPLCERRRLTIEREIDPALTGLRTDRRLLVLILKNLIENATKYAYEGTVIRVVGRLADDESRRSARFEVHDQGTGIPIGVQHRIFERFFQVDAARTGATTQRGTGLGLAIVKHAVKSLGGRVGVESVWKHGTTIWVELPQIDDQGVSGA